MPDLKPTVVFATVIMLALPGAAAVREYFAVDALPVTEGQPVVVDAWDVDIFARSADTRSVQCSTDLKISGVGAETADQWILSRTPKFSNTDSGLAITLQSGDEGFLGLASLTRRRRIGIIMPLTVHPDLTTSSGNIELVGDFAHAKPLRLRTGSGTITFRGGAAELEIRTTSGDSAIELFRPVDRISVRTSSGGVTVSGGARRAEVETASGDIELSGLSGSATAESVNGQITVTWDRLDSDAVIKLRTFKGDIVITIPSDTTPSGTLTTATGEIHSQFEGEISESGDTVTLLGTGPKFDVETASGKIVILKDGGWFAPASEE